MAISSLGVGSGILTQDVLDQLREADNAGRITPIDRNLAKENSRVDAFNIMEAHVTNLTDSIAAIGNQLLFDERSSEVTGSSVEVTADANSDVQDFTLNVGNLATKQIEESGQFGSATDLVASGAGTLSLSVGSADPISINYDGDTTLNDLKKLINEQAGDLVEATVVQISATDFRLFISSVETGESQDISITDPDNKLDNKLVNDFDKAAVQDGINANFTFNGQDIERESNMVDDLIIGLDIKLVEAGVSVVSVAQNREAIFEKIDNFVEHYNETMKELNKLTKASINSSDRGVYSVDSTIKSMKRSIEDMFIDVGGGVGYLSDFGFDVDKEGVMSLDDTILSDQFDADATNFQAFFSGGTYTKDDDSTVEVDGAFTEMSVVMESYSEYNGILDNFKASMTDTISNLEDRKLTETERLDAKYEIMKKQFAAYDLVINRLNNASDIFTQLANAQSSNN